GCPTVTYMPAVEPPVGHSKPIASHADPADFLCLIRHAAFSFELTLRVRAFPKRRRQPLSSWLRYHSPRTPATAGTLARPWAHGRKSLPFAIRDIEATWMTESANSV